MTSATALNSLDIDIAFVRKALRRHEKAGRTLLAHNCKEQLEHLLQIKRERAAA